MDKDKARAGKIPEKEAATAADHGPQEIILDVGPIDPELNPDSPEFDVEKWKEVVNSFDKPNISEHFKKIIQAFNEIPNPEPFIREAFKQRQEQFFELFKELINEFSKMAESYRITMELLEDLKPYLDEELKKPKYGGHTIEELLYMTDPGEMPGSLAAQAIDAAREAKSKFDLQLFADKKEAARKKQEEFSKVSYLTDNRIKVVSDKFIRNFFSRQERETEAHKREDLIENEVAGDSLPLKYDSDNSPTEINLRYHYVDNLTLLNKFKIKPGRDYKDLFITVVIDNLYREGNTDTTLTKILRDLGGKGSPAGKESTDLFKRLVRLRASDIMADTGEVMQVYGKKQGRFIMRPAIDISFPDTKYHFDDTGELVIEEANIHINGYSIFYELANEIGRITGYSKKFFKRYEGKRTERYYEILYYLIRQISWMRRPRGRSNKITYKELYKELGLTAGSMNKNSLMSARRSAKKIMKDIIKQQFIPEGHITGMKEAESGEPGIELTYTPTKQITASKN